MKTPTYVVLNAKIYNVFELHKTIRQKILLSSII